MDTSILRNLESKINEAVSYFKNQLATIRGNRPTPALVENIIVDYLEQKLPIKQLGSISIIPPKEIQITVWDKQVIANMAKAIESSNLKLSARTEGNTIKVSLPPLSEERRQEFVKIIKKEAENARIHIRSLRDESNKKIKAQITDEDEQFKLKQEVQKIIDKANEEIEKTLENKVREINQ